MTSWISPRIIFIHAIMGFVLAACNLPRGTVSPTGPSAAAYTAAAQTVSAQLTAAVQGPKTPSAKTATPQTTGVQIASETPSPLTSTPQGTPGETEQPCNHLTFVKDVTYPDGSNVPPGETFTKTWRLKNSGTCPWTSGYALVFGRGHAMGGPASVPLTDKEIPPGETVDVSVDLQAPEETGTYQGYWKLRSNGGQTFGYGEDAKAFWVKVDVVEGSGVVFDFNVQAEEAAWGSGVLPVDFDGPGEDVLVFGSRSGAGEPFVDVKTEQPLENGKVSGHLLVAYPPVSEGGYIIGRYPEFHVNPGDVLTGRVGLIKNPDGSCGSGDVRYRISYTEREESAPPDDLWTWNEICDGEMKSFQLALDDVEGESIQIYLVVVANTAAEDHFAVWDSLAIKR